MFGRLQSLGTEIADPITGFRNRCVDCRSRFGIQSFRLGPSCSNHRNSADLTARDHGKGRERSPILGPTVANTTVTNVPGPTNRSSSAVPDSYAPPVSGRWWAA